MVLAGGKNGTPIQAAIVALMYGKCDSAVCSTFFPGCKSDDLF